jgi:biotin synthase
MTPLFITLPVLATDKIPPAIRNLCRVASSDIRRLAPTRRLASNGRVVSASYRPQEADLTRTGSAQRALHERAAALTRERFGNNVFVRAVVEISNFCREQCAYCGMRRDNRALSRYRAQAAQLAQLLLEHRPACVTDVNLQGGEDPVAAREVALPLIETLRRETTLGISACLGTLDAALYRDLQAAGASMYIMKYESADAAHYAAFQSPGTLDERVQHVRLLAAAGWNVSSGFIAGLPGQGPGDLLHNTHFATSLPVRGCSVSPFIPGEATPLARHPPANADWTLNCMAALRLMRHDWVIPAVSALNLVAPDGYRRGLRAGANLVTINLTPGPMRGDYVIYKRDRVIMTEERVLNAIGAEGLHVSRRGLAEYYGNGALTPAAASLRTA